MSPRKLTREEEQRIYEAKTYILNHLNEELIVNELAKRCALGLQKFKEGFYLLFQMRPGEYVHHSRMQTAKFLLTHTDKRIKDIAKLMGYSEVNNFLRAFKKYFKITAGSLRNSESE